MPDSAVHLAERLRVEGEKSLAFFASLPEQAWEILIYTDGSVWKLHQIIAHYASAEANFGLLIDQILAGGSGAAEDFDLNRFNRSQVGRLETLPRQELLARYKISRQDNIARVERMQPADLDRQGRHPYLGLTSLSEIIKMIYRHNQIHQREIRQILTAASPNQLPA
ncbi:MAG TPA: DinB family protein [Anaerolineales bacterium]|nr:DinB family protein [Anaerolineales bacterium]